MTNHAMCRLLTLVFALLIAGALHAQAEQTPEKLLDEPVAEPAEAPAEEPEAADDSREVDFNEENFRRSMELRDQQLQRSPDLTTDTYSTGTGIKALDELPEASQKHLREQLREVIVQNGPWTPEQAGEVYPYTPSDEAMKNGSLEKREQAAWQELVARYHEREAAIRGLSQAGEAGEASQSGESGNAGREGEAGEGSQGMQAGTQGSEGDARQQAAERAAARAAALAEIMNSSNAAGAETSDNSAPPATPGVSQNALELLTERQQIPASTSSAAAATSAVAEAEKGQDQAQAEEAEMDLETDGIIAIEDLKKVDLDTGDSEKN